MLQVEVARHLTAERAMELLREHSEFEAVVADMAVAWNPASTKRMLYGPMKVVYILHPEGGVTAILGT